MKMSGWQNLCQSSGRPTCVIIYNRTKCDVQMAESNFQTRVKVRQLKINLRYQFIPGWNVPAINSDRIVYCSAALFLFMERVVFLSDRLFKGMM